MKTTLYKIREHEPCADGWKEDPEYWESKEETARERDAWRDSRRDPWDRELPDDQDESAYGRY